MDTHPDPTVRPEAEAKPDRRSWWSRHWKWVVPTVILLPVFSCVGVLTLIVSLIFGMIKGSEPFEDSLRAARANPQIQAALGTPIEPDFLVTGSINLSGPSGDANLAYGISGPNGTGTVFVTGDKSAGVWTYSTLLAEIDPTGQRIDLQTSSPARLP